MKTIVLDTNIWLSELALMSPVGCAFSHYITVSGFKIGLPEVVEEETKYNFRKNLFEKFHVDFSASQSGRIGLAFKTEF